MMIKWVRRRGGWGDWGGWPYEKQKVLNNETIPDWVMDMHYWINSLTEKQPKPRPRIP